MKKLTVRQHADICSGLIIAAVVMALISRFRAPGEFHFTLWIAAALVVVAFLYRLIFIKCPHCGNRLQGLKRNTMQCPGCGKNLEENPLEESDL